MDISPMKADIDLETLNRMIEETAKIIVRSNMIPTTAELLEPVGAIVREVSRYMFVGALESLRSMNMGWKKTDKAQKRRLFYSRGKHLGFKRRWRRGRR